MPPRYKTSNLLLWWLLIVPVSCMLLSEIFDKTVTLGEVIGLVLTIPALLFGVWKAIDYYILYRKFPFCFWFQLKSPYEGRPQLAKSISLVTGETEVHLRIKPRRPTSLGEVHVRLVDSPDWYKSKFPKRDAHIISVSGIRDEAALANKIIGLKPDGTNGMQGRYEEPYHCSPEKQAHIHVKLKAYRKWHGYLTLQLECADGHFRSRCRELIVTKDGVSDE